MRKISPNVYRGTIAERDLFTAKIPKMAGSKDDIRWMHDTSIAQWSWDTVSESWVSYGSNAYEAKMVQHGTSAPVATILQNTLGTITWARSSAGVYTGTLIGAFVNPERIGLQFTNVDLNVIGVSIASNDAVRIVCGDDNILNGTLSIKLF